MSNFVPKPNSGTLWPNDRKTSPNHPDFRGDVHMDRTFLQDMIDKSDGGLIKLQVSGWEKLIAGKNCLSLSVSAPYVPQERSERPQPRQVQQRPQPDEDVPF